MRSELKKFERYAEKDRTIQDGMLKLVALDVDLKGSEVLYEKENFDKESFDEFFDIKTGQWSIEDGWIIGKNPDMCPGMIVSKDDFFGDIMVEITAKMVSPSTHDINVMIHGEWDEEKDERGLAYVSGLEAFWHGNIGFEKSPEYKLTAATSLFNFDPEKEHNFKMGNIGSKVFVLIDGELCLEVTDPEPIDVNRYGKIGFEAFSSWFKFKNLKVYNLKYDRVKEYYNPEF